MLSKKDLEALAQARLDDSVALLQSQRHSSAYYLSGYAVEFALKACIAKSFQADVIPPKGFVNAIYTHKLDELMRVAGLWKNLEDDIASDPLLAASWGIASKWNEESRYQLWDPFSASSMVSAIENQKHGVFQWVKRHW
jgi:hypothetical protein